MSRVFRALVPAALVIAALAACTTGGTASSTSTPRPDFAQVNAYPDITVESNITYRTVGGSPIQLDACLPREAADGPLLPRASVVIVHGGSWRSGTKSDVNYLGFCQWLASEGYVAFTIDYRLAPQHVFPAGISDVRAAIRWVRSASTVAKYTLDPHRVGAFGGSAGGNLVALLGTEGSGDLTVGSRVAAVAELSGPTDLTADGAHLGDVVESFQRIELDYLGCETWKGCTRGQAASPIYQVDETDPPFFIGHSQSERIPLQQSSVFADILRAHNVDAELDVVPGSKHSIAMLDDAMRERILEFYRATLG